MSRFTARVRDLRPATPRSRLLTVDLRGTDFTFIPGQAVIVAAHGRTEGRPYSIACSPEYAAEAAHLELLIGLESDGGLGSHLLGTAAGTMVDIEGPIGTFTYPQEPVRERLLFVAGGTGIAPLRAMIDHALRRDPSQVISLLFSARRADEFAFITELEAHAQEGRLELHRTVTRDDDGSWPGLRGRIGRSHFEQVLHEPAATLCFVCGPPSLVNEAVTTLRALGVPDQMIRREEWSTAVPQE